MFICTTISLQTKCKRLQLRKDVYKRQDDTLIDSVIGCFQNSDAIGKMQHGSSWWCVKRNVIGAVNAVSCADMALAGIESRVPVDQVIDCMGDVGRRLPVEFRETALGGLAATPFGQAVKEQMQNKAHRE